MRTAMGRRTWLQLMTGLALSAVPAAAFQATRRTRVVVAGGGIIGASIAYRLARRGAEVTLLERSAPGTGTTANSFAWINAKKQPRAYHTLSQFGIDAWRVLDQELKGELPLVWGGSLEWIADASLAARLTEVNRQYQRWGYPIRPMDAAQMAALEPRARFDGLRYGVHAEAEASVDPQAATEIIVAHARSAGARVVHPATVSALDLPGGRLRAVRTTEGDLPADVLVIACGNDTPALATLAGIDVPLTRSAGILVHTTPQPAAIDRVLLSPLGQIKQKRNGRFVTGADFGNTANEDTSKARGEQFLKRMAAVLPVLGTAPVDKLTLGLRVMPKDGYPIIGFADGHPDIYVAAMHSGMTLGPLVGRLAASEILDGVEIDLLAPYRLARFAAGTSARHG
jgi:glycine/D-amino acid oxidase-like deaminating enzyme